MTITLIILITTIILFVTGRIRVDIVALCALTTLIIAGILTPGEALSGFSSTVVIMMVGLSWSEEQYYRPVWQRPQANG